MRKGIRVMITIFTVGLLALSRKVTVVAEEIPMAGIDIVLNEFYENKPSTITDITEYLNTNKDSEYKDLAIADVNNYVNIRNKPSEDSEIIGKIYNTAAAKVLATEGNWFKIKSGSVTGFVNSNYFVTGEEVEELAQKVGRRIATVNTETLKVRDDASKDAPVNTLVPLGEELNVKKELKGWLKISTNTNIKGYVSSDYVDIRTEFEEAVSIEEEIARLEAEAEAEEAERIAVESEARKVNNATEVNNTTNTYVLNNSNSLPQVSTNSSSKREKIVEYALRFVGNPYVWGGTSLTKGADCSGFTQSVFGDNDISIPRTSRSQASGGGREVSINNIQPGDLVFYSKGDTINHVAIYIGNGKVVAASSPETGIRVTNYNYRQPYKVVSYID